MIQHDKETLISFADAAKRLPRSPSGRPVHAKTVARWALRGIRGIKLESICPGGRRVTSVEACQRFFEALVHATNESPRRRTSDETKRLLAERGLV